MDKYNWVEEWPQKEGFYWYWGWCFKPGKEPAEFHFVRVAKGMNSFAYITNGHFMYKSEGGVGWWSKANLPKPPLEKLIKKTIGGSP